MTTSTAEQVSALNKKLEAYASKLKNPVEANRAAAIQIYGWVIDNFDSEGGKVGGWEPVTEARARYKASIGKEKILVITGALRGGFVPFHDSSNAGVRNFVPYAVDHEFGVEERNLPARRMLPDRKQTLDIGMPVYRFYAAKSKKEARL